ncbi:glycosyl hydrolase family 18 protein [Paenibacillus koleovorans]|uniref:glycosyl hydrolase family 18 protein n=1 Tax=Paenibacillus koleovorans TaxID=121608 RepID=UPI000FDCA2E4|nr:glycosyl hydrolase family 18 protein [Paenibacillus koleovorans]
MRRSRTLVALLLSLVLLIPATVSADDLTTKYRVYQNDVALNEYSNLQQAIQYAQWFNNSYVEEIGSRRWVWSNFPRYRIYQKDTTRLGWEFASLDAAIAEAKKWDHTSVRDLQGTGWVWNNYPRYRLMQGEITLDSWEFATLQEATWLAPYYTGLHVIDMTTNRWVWDNIAPAEKVNLRAGAVQYRVFQDTYTQPDWQFAYLEDAVNEALRWENSRVERIDNKKTVYANAKTVKVYQSGRLVNEFVNMDDAIAWSQWFLFISIKVDGKEIWNNYGFYRVYQNENYVSEHKSLPDALYYASHYTQASVRTYDGQKLWNNYRKLQFWGWNGSSAMSTIQAQVNNTTGLDVDSPTWFQLADAEGNLKDTSSVETVNWLKSRGYAVHPLVSNQFDAALTSQFLTNPAAQTKFINALVNRSVQLGVHGINIDFENIAGKDRAALSTFVTNLSSAARAKGLIVSIDLPRGSIKWNHLSAFDHQKLAGVVDYIITMAYDQHYSGSPVAGSVSGLQWAEEGVQEFLSYGIPREKLILGIPYYVREWKIDASGALVSNRAIFMKDIPALIASKKATTQWDASFNQYRIDYYEGEYRYVLWLENEDTVKARLVLAKKYDLAGVAAWRLGYESADMWKTMLQYK